MLLYLPLACGSAFSHIVQYSPVVSAYPLLCLAWSSFFSCLPVPPTCHHSLSWPNSVCFGLSLAIGVFARLSGLYFGWYCLAYGGWFGTSHWANHCCPEAVALEASPAASSAISLPTTPVWALTLMMVMGWGDSLIIIVTSCPAPLTRHVPV